MDSPDAAGVLTGHTELHSMEQETAPPQPADITTITKKLGSHNPKEVAQAEREVERYDSRGLETLLAILRVETQKFSSRRRLYWILIWLWMIMLLSIGFGLEHWLGTRHPFIKIFWICGILLNCVIRLLYPPSRTHRWAVARLARHEDVAAIGLLVDNLELHAPEIYKALARLLPQVNASQSHLLNAGQRTRLYRVLMQSCRGLGKSITPREFVIAALKALEQIGDKEALPVVERLAKRKDSPAIRQAALDCLPYLQERAERSQAEETLLRASSSTTSPEQLLRPANSTTETLPTQLLRPSSLERS